MSDDHDNQLTQQNNNHNLGNEKENFPFGFKEGHSQHEFPTEGKATADLKTIHKSKAVKITIRYLSQEVKVRS